MEYWDCDNGCGSRIDNDLNVIDDVAIPALGHEYSATYQWKDDGSSCTVGIVCAHDAAHNHEVDVAAESSVKVAATCTAAGTTTYSVSGTYDGFAYSSTKDVDDIPALGHTEVQDKAIPATKTSAGHAAGTHCSVCGIVLSGNEEVPMLPADASKTGVAAPGDSAVMEKDSVQKVIDDGLALEVEGSTVSVEIPNSVLSDAIEGRDGDVRVDVLRISLGDLNASQREAAGDADMVMSLGLFVGGTEVHGFGDKVKVTVDYVPPSGKDASRMYVVYLREDGGTERIDCEYEDGKVSFSTGHFSCYAVMYDPLEEDGSSGGGGSLLLAGGIAAVLAVAALLGFLLIRRRG